MSLLPFEQSLANKKILITGHSGFTGGWACLWLQTIGAEIAGFSLPPDTKPSLFEALKLENSVATTFADLCDYDAFLKTVDSYQPEIILHLAAQPLVRRSYNEPMRTFAVNSQGTVHVLEAARLVKSVRAVLCVTTDKVYKNNEWLWPYREDDPLGGKDPYSASKSAAEMVIHSYAASFPWQEKKGPAIAIARGGNIIGGGDWSEDRLIPDFVRAVTKGETLTLRYPEATRPWQHVLALVQGYLVLLAGLISDNPATFARAWNLGPQDPESYSVRDVLEMMSSCWERPDLNYMENPYPEAKALALDSSMAKALLKWNPVWDTKQVIAETAAWYREYYANPNSTKQLTLSQIKAWRVGIK
ncbi:MAG: CDP-glucose 4,6-dehydratase [Tatlockia sp.]|nr:CDP-glucose 4,6-dehydratase [Tatlockia sp.]